MSLGDFRSIFMPYCLQRQEDGSWLVLNREYKPVGFNTRAHIDYAEYPVSVRLKGIGPARLAKLSYKADFNPDRVYLYNDGCVPTQSAANMNAYLGRLRILASLTVDDTRR